MDSMAPYVVLDSGKRQAFSTGCHRDARGEKGRFDLLSPFALARDALLYERGAVKYDARNWEKGMPFSRCIDSALRHLNKYVAGDRVEDHLAAARFNIACIMHYEEMIQRDLLPAELCDLPSYAPLLPSQVSAEVAPVSPPRPEAAEPAGEDLGTIVGAVGGVNKARREIADAEPAGEPEIWGAVCADCNGPLKGQGAHNPCDCAAWSREISPSPDNDKETPNEPPTSGG